MSRAVNPLSNEVLEHVNAENSIIVVYDWDGKIAAPACALLSEKGVQLVDTTCPWVAKVSLSYLF